MDGDSISLDEPPLKRRLFDVVWAAMHSLFGGRDLSRYPDYFTNACSHSPISPVGIPPQYVYNRAWFGSGRPDHK